MSGSRRRFQVTCELYGASFLKSKKKAHLRDPALKYLLENGFEIADHRAFKITDSHQKTEGAHRTSGAKGAKPFRAGLTAEVPFKKNTAFIACLVHPGGGITWHFEKKKRGKKRKHTIAIFLHQRSSGKAGPASSPRSHTAGIYTFILLAMTIAPGLAAKPMAAIARKWEETRIAHAIYRIGEKGISIDPPLKTLPHHDGKRGLLLIHGAFSSTASSFDALFEEPGFGFLKTLLSHYRGRVAGFDHPTISMTPEENARWLLEHLEAGKTCLYDIVAYSRGGLVARALVEMARASSESIRGISTRLIIDRVVLVGVPNRGTPLAPAAGKAAHGPYETLASWLANIASIMPGRMLPLAMDFLAELLKYLAAGIAGVLPGIAALSPGSAFLKKLNAPSPLGGVIYFALGANYSAPNKLLLKLADAGLDKLFRDKDNDLAVPTEECRIVDELVPPRRSALFASDTSAASLRASIHHFAFFKKEKCLGRISDFLGIPKEAWRSRTRAAGPSLESASQPKSPARQKYPLKRPRVYSVPLLAGVKPDFTVPLPRMEVAVIGDRHREREHKKWLQKWKKAIAAANIKDLPPEPFPLLMVESGLSRMVSTFKTKGDDTYWHSLIGTERSLRRYLEDAGPELSLARLRRAGAMLFSTLFPREAKELFERTATQTRGHAPVLVTFTTTSPWIADFPWEMLFDTHRGRFLSLGDVCFFRGVISTQAAVMLPALPLVIRMLVAIAQPRDQVALDAEKEVKGLKEALAPLIESRRLYIDVLEHTSAKSLQSQLKKTHYHILHYIGHGDYDEENDAGKLILETNRAGLSSPVDADALCAMLISHASHLRLVLLNGCETAEGGKADFNRGVAPALVAAGMPGVVGNRLIVGDRAAITFATTFYEELSQRRSFAEAITIARRRLAFSPGFEPFEWAVPIIFAIDPEARFF